MNPTWFGYTPDLRLREDGPVPLEDALRRASQVVAETRPYYQRGEDALVATTFGLSFAENHFVEFSVHQPDEIAMRFEVPGVPWYRRLFRGRDWNLRTLRSPAEMSQAIEQFFTLAPAQLDVAFRSGGAA